MQVLEILSAWPLFGSSFFAVRREAEPKEGSEHILALNKNGVAFLDLITHETLLHYPFTEVRVHQLNLLDGDTCYFSVSNAQPNVMVMTSDNYFPAEIRPRKVGSRFSGH